MTRLVFVDDRRLRLMERFSRPFTLLTGWDVERTIKLMRPLHELLKGVPTDTALASAYWRKKMPPPRDPDPDRDKCGLLWCSPIVPNTGAHATDVAGLVSAIALEHGFEPIMSLSVVTERTIVCVAAITYDRDIAGEDQRALGCHRALISALLERGYPPYRLTIRSMGAAGGGRGHNQVLHALKSALDPAGVLAPGRYEPGERPKYRVIDAPVVVAG